MIKIFKILFIILLALSVMVGIMTIIRLGKITVETIMAIFTYTFLLILFSKQDD